jgi:hypothetical protein
LGRLEGRAPAHFRLVAQHAATIFAQGVFKKDLLPALIAVKGFHDIGQVLKNDWWCTVGRWR